MPRDTDGPSVQALLKDIFGFDAFRPGQGEIVEAVAAGENVLAIMPTGGGKSLCFQLPALVRPGVTVVISPLIALMRDQVRGLREAGVAAGALTSGNTQEESDAVWDMLHAGELKLLYLAPERLAGAGTQRMLAEAGFISAFIIIALMMLEVGRVTSLPTVAVWSLIGAFTLVYAWFSRSAGRPLYILFVLLMIPLAVTELSTDSWITELMEPEMTAIGLQAGWVLVYTSAIMFVVRMNAGPLLHRAKPLGVLAGASALAAIGLFWLSGATGLALLAAATLYGVGKSFFWGTSLAVVSEQFPRGGAVTLNVMAGAGMLAAGIVGTVMLGAMQDRAITRGLDASTIRSRRVSACFSIPAILFCSARMRCARGSGCGRTANAIPSWSTSAKRIGCSRT